MTYTAGESHPGLFSRLINALGPKGLFTWLVLLIALISAITGLADVIKGLEFSFAFIITVMAATAGWLMAMLPVADWLGAVAGILLGIELVLLRVGHLEGVIFKILESTVSLLFDIGAWLWAWIWAIVWAIYEWAPIVPVTWSIDWSTLPSVYVELWGGFGTMLTRAATWLGSLITGSGTFDPVATALIWGFVLWLCAWWAGWAVNRRYDPLLGILPGGLLVSFILAYTWASSAVLLPMMGFTFLLMALARHRARETRWQITGIDFSRDLWSDVVMITAGVSLSLMVLAAVSPAFTLDKLEDLIEWIDDLSKDGEQENTPQIADSLGIEQQPQPRLLTPVERAHVTTLPRRHLIGSGPELSRIVVMIISTGELPALPDISYMGEDVPRHYWRSLTYDRYYSQGWATSNTAVTRYEPGEEALAWDIPFHRPLRQEVQIIGEWDGTLYVDGQLISVDKNFEIHFRPPAEIFAATTEEKNYRADSIYPVVTDEDLRNAGTGTPDWVQERYLQLPENLPGRVHELALELTATEPTAYDRAKAIEHYLRAFPYTLDVRTPLLGYDIADYFLFELKKGYCDYYATAMVVLARAAGLPARLVIGYAGGNYDSINARYIVTEADAHAWPEIYFPNIGWIEFEPTGGYPEIDRSLVELDDTVWPEHDPLVEPTERTGPRIVVGMWLGYSIGGVLGLALLITAVDSLFLLVWGSPRSMITRLYHRLKKYRSALRARGRIGQTPYEMADALSQRLEAIGKGRELAEELLPDAADEIRALIELYVQAWYSPRALTQHDRWVAARTWWVLRWRLWLARLLRSPQRERAPMPAAPRPLPEAYVGPPQRPAA